MVKMKPITLETLQAYKQAGEKFSVLTCYDSPTARIMQQAGVEVLLVGDTAAEVVLGLASTRDISPEFLIELTAAVRRGAPDVVVMADLPYACRIADDLKATVDWVRQFHDRTRCDIVKIEVMGDDVGLIEACGDAGIPTVAHLGLLPQNVDPAEGYRAQGRDAASAKTLIDNAKRFADAGADMLLLEAVASEVAGEITRQSPVPVIGCVAGPSCDGTVVVLHDMISLGGGHPPRGIKQYLNLSSLLHDAFSEYVADIHTGRFPTEEGIPHMKAGEWDKLNTQTSGDI